MADTDTDVSDSDSVSVVSADSLPASDDDRLADRPRARANSRTSLARSSHTKRSLTPSSSASSLPSLLPSSPSSAGRSLDESVTPLLHDRRLKHVNPVVVYSADAAPHSPSAASLRPPVVPLAPPMAQPTAAARQYHRGPMAEASPAVALRALQPVASGVVRARRRRSADSMAVAVRALPSIPIASSVVASRAIVKRSLVARVAQPRFGRAMNGAMALPAITRRQLVA